MVVAMIAKTSEQISGAETRLSDVGRDETGLVEDVDRNLLAEVD